ncbi:MAG: hypothetical protein COA65_09690 [Rhodospirillaceae bacterium]|nr:MAG: hypothetical protein COA65_09690 [Rhodospirillaceae bacterium]
MIKKETIIIEVIYCDHCGEQIKESSWTVVTPAAVDGRLKAIMAGDKHYHSKLQEGMEDSCYNSYLAGEPPTFLTITTE